MQTSVPSTQASRHRRLGKETLSEIRSVLVLCLPGIGDTLLTTPAIKTLKLGLPQAKVTVLTMLEGARWVAEHCSYVDEVLHFDFQGESVFRSLKFVFDQRRRRFDASVLAYPSNRLEYNLISFLVGAATRIGHRYNHLDLVCGNWLNNVAIRENDELCNIEENLKMVELLTGEGPHDRSVAFALDKDHKAFARKWLSDRGLENATVVGLHPGCDARKNHARRRWPPNRFAELGRVLAKEARARILVFGGPEEEELKTQVVAGIGSDAFCVDTPGLLEACALLETCGHFVTNDSGLMHFAGALGVPTTAIFGPTNPKWLRNPSAVRDEITLGLPCQPCFYYSPRHLRCRHEDYRCIHEVTVAEVAGNVLRRLASPSSFSTTKSSTS